MIIYIYNYYVYIYNKVILFLSSVLGNHGDANDKYLERSKIPTMHFQASLPRLPIPDLEATCQRYLRALRPVLSDEEYERTEKEVARFSKPQSDGWGKGCGLCHVNYNEKLLFRTQPKTDFTR